MVFGLFGLQGGMAGFSVSLVGRSVSWGTWPSVLYWHAGQLNKLMRLFHDIFQRMRTLK